MAKTDKSIRIDVHGMYVEDAMELLQPAWLLELSELSALKRSELEGVKQFLSRQVDEYRPAYAERTEKRPRHCVFFGTTNETSFLKGDTGNRRCTVQNLKLEQVRAEKNLLLVRGAVPGPNGSMVIIRKAVKKA